MSAKRKPWSRPAASFVAESAPVRRVLPVERISDHPGYTACSRVTEGKWSMKRSRLSPAGDVVQQIFDRDTRTRKNRGATQHVRVASHDRFNRGHFRC